MAGGGSHLTREGDGVNGEGAADPSPAYSSTGLPPRALTPFPYRRSVNSAALFQGTRMSPLCPLFPFLMGLCSFAPRSDTPVPIPYGVFGTVLGTPDGTFGQHNECDRVGVTSPVLGGHSRGAG